MGHRVGEIEEERRLALLLAQLALLLLEVRLERARYQRRERLGLADAAHAPGAIPGALPLRRLDGVALAGDLEGAGVAAGLGEPGVLHDRAVEALLDRLGLLERGLSPVPDDVEGEAPLVVVALDPELLQPFEDFELEGADGGVQSVAAELTGGADRILRVAMGDRREGVGHAEVRVLAETEDHEELVARRVQIEVVAIEEVAIAGEDVVEGVGGLMGEIVVHRAERHFDSSFGNGSTNSNTTGRSREGEDEPRGGPRSALRRSSGRRATGAREPLPTEWT